jgi:anti-sigma-K factor RskA
MPLASTTGATHPKSMGRAADRRARCWRALVLVAAAGAAAAGVRRAPPPPPPPTPGYDELCARLHRLDVEIARLARSDGRTPALYHRLLATSLAYDGALRETCAIMGVAVPGGPPPFDSVARLQAEAGLNAAGLHW